MKNKIKLLGIIAVIAVIGFSMAACPSDGGDSDVGTFLNGTWKRSSLGIKLDGNNWTYFEDGSDYSKGTWKCSVMPAAGISGATLTLTVTHINIGGWQSLPSEYNSVKTNTAKLAINEAGTTMTISDPTLTTDGVWGTLAGTYTKE